MIEIITAIALLCQSGTTDHNSISVCQKKYITCMDQKWRGETRKSDPNRAEVLLKLCILEY